MKKLLILGLTMLFIIALSVSAAAEAPAKSMNGTKITVTGSVVEVRENEVLVTAEGGEKYSIPTVFLKNNENYKNMKLKVGDKLEVVGSKAVAAIFDKNSVDNSLNKLQTDTIKIHIDTPLSKDVKNFQGTIKMADKTLKFIKVDGSYVIENADGIKTTITVPKTESNITLSAKPGIKNNVIIVGSKEANIIVPEKITANGITAVVER